MKVKIRNALPENVDKAINREDIEVHQAASERSILYEA
jgi:hypothetical protein